MSLVPRRSLCWSRQAHATVLVCICCNISANAQPGEFESLYMQAQGDDEVDPLDAYMLDISSNVKDNKPATAKAQPGIELDEEDNVADFLEVNAP